MALTTTDFDNAKQDVDHIRDLATSPELTATDRFGTVKKTWAGIVAELSAAATILLARMWATKTDGPVADGEYSAKYYAGASASSAAAAAGQVVIATDKATQTTNDRIASETAAANALAAANYKTNRAAVRLATAAALPTNTYAGGVITMSATGVLTVDGVAVALNDAVVVKDETDQTKNGIYTCTTAGASGVAAVLTRRSTESTGATLAAACVQVTAGTVNTGWTFLCQQSAITLGTTLVSFAGQAGAVGAEAATRLSTDNSVQGQLSMLQLAVSTLMGFKASAESRLSALEVQTAELITDVAALWASIESTLDQVQKPSYFISSVNPAASDSNNGTSKSTPWATIAPLLALAATPGALTGKMVAFERRGFYGVFDQFVADADDCIMTAYGTGDRPKFECRAAIPAAWTLHSAGVYKITLSRTADSSTAGNFWRNNDTPLRKVESVAALAGKGDYVCFLENYASATPTLYMNAPADPNTDGAIYLWSKYGHALALRGSRNRMDSLWAIGGAHQGGNFRLNGSGGGGNVLSRSRSEWGDRHNCYLNSGVLPCVVELCEFLGGANDVDGGVLNGTANAVVYNHTDQTMATCISRYNVIDGRGRRNYNTNVRSNFVGLMAHDNVEGRPMQRFESIGDVFIDVVTGTQCPGQTNLLKNAEFKRAMTAFTSGITTQAVSLEVTGIVAGSTIDQLTLLNGARTLNLNYHDNGRVDILDCGLDGAGWVRAGENTAVLNAVFANSEICIKGVRIQNVSKRLIWMRAGTLKWTGMRVGPNLAPPVDHMFHLAAAVTLDPANGGNSWPIGCNFLHGSTTYYGLQQWQAAGKEAGSVYLPMPPAEITDSFTGADANLGDTPGWTRLNGNAGDLQRKGGVLYGNTTTGGNPSVYTRGDLSSTDQYVRFINRSTATSGGPALRVVDAVNLMYSRWTSGAYQFMRVTAGVSGQLLLTTVVTPAVGQEVINVVRRYLDPFTLTYSLRACTIVDGGLYTSCLQIASDAVGTETELTCGAATRSSIGEIADDVMYGAAPMTLQ